LTGILPGGTLADLMAVGRRVVWAWRSWEER
jgi:hypothetical protein